MPSKNYICDHVDLTKFKWKTAWCNQGESCWCRVITTEEPVFWSPDVSGDDDDEAYIAGSGSIPKDLAEHIVELHNRSLE